MTITRRGFLTGILALGAAPAIVRAQSIMPVAPRIWTPRDPYGERGFITLDMLRNAAKKLDRAHIQQDHYVLVVHPDLDVEVRRELLKYADRLYPLSTVHVPRSLLS